MVLANDLLKKYPNDFIEILGNPQSAAKTACELAQADKNPEALVFARDAAALQLALAARAVLIIAPQDLRPQLDEKSLAPSTVILCAHFQRAMARVLPYFDFKARRFDWADSLTKNSEAGAENSPPSKEALIDASAEIHPSAIIGADVQIGPRAKIGAWVQIGEGTQLGEGVVISSSVQVGAACHLGARTQVGPGTQIASQASLGEGCLLAPTVVIGSEAQLGDRCQVGPGCLVDMKAQVGEASILHSHVHVGAYCSVGSQCEIHPHTTLGSDGYGYAPDSTGPIKIAQIGRVVIEDQVEIGANCAIDRATLGETRIGQGTKIDNLCHIAHNVKIGRHCFITAGFLVAGSSEIGDGFSCGGGVAVSDHVKISAGVQLAGRSIVNKSIDSPGAYGGHPLQPLKDYLRITASLPSLPEMRKSLAQLKKS